MTEFFVGLLAFVLFYAFCYACAFFPRTGHVVKKIAVAVAYLLTAAGFIGFIYIIGFIILR